MEGLPHRVDSDPTGPPRARRIDATCDHSEADKEQTAVSLAEDGAAIVGR